VETRATVLLVEDDAPLAELIASYLTEHGFDVIVEPRGDRAEARVRASAPRAVVLDINLPGKDGLAVCRDIRPSYEGAIVMLTARGDDVDEVLGLEIGADDYIAKPVRPRILLARLRAALRRGEARGASPLRFGPLSIDESRRSVTLRGEMLPMSTAEFDLLLVLAKNAGRVLSREDIAEALGTPAYAGQSRTIDLRVSRLRRILGDDAQTPAFIKSVRGTGYLFAAPQ
jgi:DNA-binding response OmpR family regulator